ncbi:MAG: ferredoxin Fer [Halobacteriaceae archaeon]
MDSPYEVLGLDPDADEADVVRAYRRRVKEAHPDQGGSAAEFEAVKAAYERLSSGVDDAALDVPEEDEADETDLEDAHVEYLNYEVLDDHGWELDDDDLFERAADADLDPADHGEFEVAPHESLLEAAESCGFAWPYACRGGACANCAVATRRGELSMPVGHVLPPEMLDRDIRLSCNGIPVTDELRVVYNVKHLPDLEDLRLPPHPFKLAHSDD